MKKVDCNITTKTKKAKIETLSLINCKFNILLPRLQSPLKNYDFDSIQIFALQTTAN